MGISEKHSFAPIFLTVFIDLLGVGIIIPVLAPLLLDVSHGIVASATSFSARTAILGLLVATYPLAQFFGAPLLGGWSDRVGRKKALIISLVGTLLGYLLFALAIVSASLPLLFISRALDGFTGGNISIAMSAIADMSDEKTKGRNFGLIGMAFGLGFIFGPYIGGKLADPSLVSWFTYATPFWFAAILTAVNILMVVLRFRETSTHRVQREMSLLTGVRNIGRSFKMANLRTLFAVMFMFIFGFNFFTQFFQVYLIDKFHYTQSNIGDFFAYIGIWIALTQGLLNGLILKWFASSQILRFSLIGLSVSLAALLIPSTTYGLLIVTPFVAIFNGLSFPNANAVISNQASRDSQGEILGINQSIQSLAMAIPPIISGFIFNIHQILPIVVASWALFVAWLIYIVLFQQVRKLRA